MTTSVQQSVFEVMADILECEEGELSMNYGKEASLKWDSVNTLRILTQIEFEFNIRLDMERFLEAEIIKDIVDLVEASLNGK